MKKSFFTKFALLLLVGVFLLSGLINAEEPVTLKILQYAPEMTDAMHEMAKEYHKQFPNVTLDFTILQTDYIPVLQAKLNSGDMPDIFMSGAYNDNKLYADYCYDLTKVPAMKNVVPSTLAGVKLNGKIIGFPFIMQSYSFIYNKKLFAEAGITKLPRTLKEYTEVCEKLKSKGITPFGTGYREWWILEQTMTNLFGQVKGNYNKLFTDLNSGKKKFSKLKEVQSVFNWVDLTIKYGEDKPLETDFNAQCALIANDKVAMIHNGSWAENTIKSINPKANIGFLLVSASGNPKDAGLMVDSNITYRICKQSKHLKEALKWLDWVINSDYGKKFVPELTSQFSTVKGAPFPKSQLAEDTATYMKTAKTYPWLKGMWPQGTEMPLPTELQSYVAKSKTKAQVSETWDQIWMKAVRASQ